MPPGPHRVVYIGSAGDLRKRLGDHLRGSSDNPLLYRHIADGAARGAVSPDQRRLALGGAGVVPGVLRNLRCAAAVQSHEPVR